MVIRKENYDITCYLGVIEKAWWMKKAAGERCRQWGETGSVIDEM